MISAALLFLAFASFVGPFAIGQRYGLVRWLSPLHVVAYLAFAGVFVKTLSRIWLPSSGFLNNFYYQPNDLLDGYLYLFLFVLFICLGYTLAVRQPVHKRQWGLVQGLVSSVRYLQVLFLSSFLISAVVIGAVLSGRGLGGLSSAFSLQTLEILNSQKLMRLEGIEGYGASFSAFKTFLFVPAFAFITFLLRWLKFKRSGDLIAVIIIFFFQLFLTVFEGSRFGLIFIFTNIAFGFLVAGGRVRLKSLLKASAMITLFAAFFLAMTSMRERRGDDFGASTFDAAAGFNQVVNSTYFLDVNMSVLVLSRLRYENMLWGASYGTWIIAWIPRQVWPDKPAVSLGPYVKQEIFEMRGTVGGINPTAPAEAFINFGWLGLIVGIVLGFMFRALEEMTMSREGILRRGGLWVYPIVVLPFTVRVLQSSFSAALVTAIVTWVLLLGALYIFSGGALPQARNTSRLAVRAIKTVR